MRLRSIAYGRQGTQVYARCGGAMAEKKDVTRSGSTGEVNVIPSAEGMIDSFLSQAKDLGPAGEAGSRARLVFALDATMSRQPTWDLACRVQGEMFATAAGIGGADVQLRDVRGLVGCRASRRGGEVAAAHGRITQTRCRGGQTQIARVLRHGRQEAAAQPVKVLVYVGDAVEEPIDSLCALAGELGLNGVKALMFHEGADRTAASAFKEVARLSGGAC